MCIFNIITTSLSGLASTDIYSGSALGTGEKYVSSHPANEDPV